MENSQLKIISNSEFLKFQIEKGSEFNFFHMFMLSIMTIGHVIIGLFIFNSISNDGIFAIKVAFVIFALIMLWSINKQLRGVLVFVKGREEIEIDEECINYKGEFGIFKKALSMKLNKIKKLDLIPLGTDKISQSSNMFTQMKYGMITIEKSKRKKISFGQSLEKQELENLYTEIKKRIKMPE
ncbi:hypothetical protein [Algoriphagus sp. Y33]|uniref:hypothetical protein n=1 Tax=Algoriphagus sp. Y33 TaxID=2772483 RepID=UPI001785EA43|nr:hypothetical protein [Algoriphagus sp. Y33]